METWDEIFNAYQKFIKQFPEHSNDLLNRKNSFKSWLKRNYQTPNKI